MFIKSTQFLSGSLQQELQRFTKDQGFGYTYSEMDKEFRSERVAVQAKNPETNLNNGFVEQLGVANTEKKSESNGAKIESSVQEDGTKETNVLKRLSEGRVEITLQRQGDLSVPFDDSNMMLEGDIQNRTNGGIHTSMNAVMNVLGEDNHSQKMLNDSSNWAQNQYERVERVEEQLQSRSNDRYDRNKYDRNKYDRFDSRADNLERRMDSNFLKSRETSRLDSQRLQDRREEERRLSDRFEQNTSQRTHNMGVSDIRQRRMVQEDKERRQARLNTKNEVGRDLKETQSNVSHRSFIDRSVENDRKTELVSPENSIVNTQGKNEHLSVDKKQDNKSSLAVGKENLAPGGKISSRDDSLLTEINQGVPVGTSVDSQLQELLEVYTESVDIQSQTDDLSLSFELLQNAQQQTHLGAVGLLDNASQIAFEDMMTLSDIQNVLSGQNSILSNDMLVSNAVALQDELLELDEVLNGIGENTSHSGMVDGMLSGVLHSGNMSSITVSSGRSARMTLLQQLQNIARPLSRVLHGMQAVQQNPNMTLLDDFILDMKWEQQNQVTTKNTKPSLFSKEITSHMFHNEVKNVLEQGLKASSVVDQRALDNVRGSSLLTEEQVGLQIASNLGTSLDGGQTGSSQQDISSLLQNVDTQQLKSLQKGTSRAMFSRMVRVIERLMEQYKPPFDPNVLKQLEIRIQDPAGVIILDISQDKSQILVKAIIPDSLHEELAQSKADVEKSLSEQGLELGSWEMTKQSESDVSRNNGNHSSKNDEDDVGSDGSNVGDPEKSNQREDRLFEKNI